MLSRRAPPAPPRALGGDEDQVFRILTADNQMLKQVQHDSVYYCMEGRFLTASAITGIMSALFS